MFTVILKYLTKYYLLRRVSMRIYTAEQFCESSQGVTFGVCLKTAEHRRTPQNTAGRY